MLVQFVRPHHSRMSTTFHVHFPTTATLPVYSRKKNGLVKFIYMYIYMYTYTMCVYMYIHVYTSFGFQRYDDINTFFSQESKRSISGAVHLHIHKYTSCGYPIVALFTSLLRSKVVRACTHEGLGDT